MSEQLEVNVTLTNQKVQFTGISTLHPDRPVMFDYHPPIGDDQGYTGLEMLLMSLAACSATAVVSLLRKMRTTIAGFRVHAKGVRRDQHPTSFQQISLEFIVSSPDATAANVQKAIQLSEESICPVWAMVKNNVEIVTSYEILAPSDEAASQIAPMAR